MPIIWQAISQIVGRESAPIYANTFKDATRIYPLAYLGRVTDGQFDMAQCPISPQRSNGVSYGGYGNWVTP